MGILSILRLFLPDRINDHTTMNPSYIYRSEQYNCQMNELMFQAGVKGMSERSELIPCIIETVT